MDTFDLNWPNTAATFCTNGWRCRIVWRGRKGGMGGTIENNDQCKRRVADSLDGAPGLLDDLRAAGYMDLADEIQTLAPLPASAAPQRSAEQRPEVTKAPAASKPAPSADEIIRSWADSFDGETAWESCANRRAKSWLHAAGMAVAAGGESWHEDVYLKAPAAKGKQEWVLKCVWEAAPKGDPRAAPRYYSAESFAGICTCIAAQPEYRSIEFIDAFMAGIVEFAEAHAGVKEAVDGWAGQKALLEKPTAVH